MTGSAQVIRGDARHLPLPDDSVDLVVTSPPYFALRDYRDADASLAGQVGSEATPAEFVAALLEVTAECVRVLKPSGSMWVNLGDKYAGGGGQWDKDERPDPQKRRAASGSIGTGGNTFGLRAKSLIGIPWRYALACIDDLGLILRAEVIWSKPNGLPESVTDRVRRSHETWFHFTLQPRYYSAVDEIRDRNSDHWERYSGRKGGVKSDPTRNDAVSLNLAEANPLGKLPGSVWTVKEDLWDHVLSGPMHFCPRCGSDLTARTAGRSTAITTPTVTPPSTRPESASDARPDSSTKSSSDPSQPDSPSTTSAATSGASTPTISNPSPSKKTSDDETPPIDATTAQPGTPTTSRTHTSEAMGDGSAACVCETGLRPIERGSVWSVPTEPLQVPDHLGVDHFAAFPTEWPRRIITGWSPREVCSACGEGRRPVVHKPSPLGHVPASSVARVSEPRGRMGATSTVMLSGSARMKWEADHPVTLTGYACACPNTTAPTTPGVVVDPFGGTGTTAMVAKALGRHGITVDLSQDYCRLARWRTNDPDQLAKACGIRRSDQARAADGLDMDSLFDIDGGAA